MAMNKAERQRLENLEHDLEIERALRFPCFSRPSPMTIDDIKANLVEGGDKYKTGEPEMVARGWFMNEHTGRVTYGCSNGHYHSTDGDTTTSQFAGAMYASQYEALCALRWAATTRAAEKLAEIDLRIRSSLENRQQELADTRQK